MILWFHYLKVSPSAPLHNLPSVRWLNQKHQESNWKSVSCWKYLGLRGMFLNMGHTMREGWHSHSVAGGTQYDIPWRNCSLWKHLHWIRECVKRREQLKVAFMDWHPLSCMGGQEPKRLKPSLGEGNGLERGFILMSRFVSYYPVVNELN